MYNPFIITGYAGPEYFCDRERETEALLSAVENGRNTVLFSIRRLGKTQLIHHVFDKLKCRNDVLTVYFDIYHTRDITGFTLAFADAVFSSLTTDSTSMLEKAAKVLSNLRVMLSIDPFSGMPTLQLDLKSPRESELSLKMIFEHIAAQKKEVVIAIDEFQQVSKYPEGNIEALLRAMMQSCPNARFIFSGSINHLLVSMFASANRPFYQSADLLKLNKIDTETYTKFIQHHFAGKGVTLAAPVINDAIDWCRNHTYYVQRFFNRLYSANAEEIGEKEITDAKREVLREAESLINDYVNFYTHLQWDLLQAIAREDGATGIYSAEFLRKNDLGSASSVRTTMQSLLRRDSIYEEDGKYYVSDVFFSRWLQYRGR